MELNLRSGHYKLKNFFRPGVRPMLSLYVAKKRKEKKTTGEKLKFANRQGA